MTDQDDHTTRADFAIREGEKVAFALTWHSSHLAPPPYPDPPQALADATRFWTDWSARSTYTGPHSEAVMRYLITLKAFTYAPTGAIVAAPTTPLPEQLGGARNWDYCYTWVSDAAITLVGLVRTGCPDEAEPGADGCFAPSRRTPASSRSCIASPAAATTCPKASSTSPATRTRCAGGGSLRFEEGGLDTPMSPWPESDRPWRPRLDPTIVNRETHHLRTACWVVVAYLSGLRDDEARLLGRERAFTEAGDDGRIRCKLRGRVHNYRMRPAPAASVRGKPPAIRRFLGDRNRAVGGDESLHATEAAGARGAPRPLHEVSHVGIVERGGHRGGASLDQIGAAQDARGVSGPPGSPL